MPQKIDLTKPEEKQLVLSANNDLSKTADLWQYVFDKHLFPNDAFLVELPGSPPAGSSRDEKDSYGQLLAGIQNRYSLDCSPPIFWAMPREKDVVVAGNSQSPSLDMREFETGAMVQVKEIMKAVGMNGAWLLTTAGQFVRIWGVANDPALFVPIFPSRGPVNSLIGYADLRFDSVHLAGMVELIQQAAPDMAQRVCDVGLGRAVDIYVEEKKATKIELDSVSGDSMTFVVPKDLEIMETPTQDWFPGWLVADNGDCKRCFHYQPPLPEMPCGNERAWYYTERDLSPWQWRSFDV
ncbi:hypothetical protein V2A60_009344 [Cordyceps javanica]|uniref:Uncharacterized protein n=1 Tax=Cordyceps javanica TaxID=43265 RepID=A0A545UNV7_9HYPO|nr:hypothetical protein IF1G_10033 [Cordyceps javanica]TQW03060.1 hypothetical protein IF2G_09577 [Cordyceps javanica]